MMPPGHIAITWAAAKLLTKQSLDYRRLAFSAMLPDLVDKPLALWVFTQSHSSQNLTHALLPNLLLLGIAVWKWPRALPYVLAFNGHLLADRMWRKTETFWWPLFGGQTFSSYRFMNTPQAMTQVYLDILRRYPHVWAIELLAGLYLGWFIKKHRLANRANLLAFLQTGQLSED